MIHCRAETYLPRLSGQSSRDYWAYVERSLFYNATQRTVNAMCGLLFRKKPQMMVPDMLMPVTEMFDMYGNSINTFASKVAEEVITTGRAGCLVDYRESGDGTMPNMPYVCCYQAEDIISWDVEYQQGRPVLKHVVLCERRYENNSNMFNESYFQSQYNRAQSQYNRGSDIYKTWYRVLDIHEGVYRQRLFCEDCGPMQLMDEFTPMNAGMRMDYIPFVIINSFYMGFDVQKPPLLDLVNANISHYKTSADLEHGCHFTALPTPVVIGVSKDDIGDLKIGSTTAWMLADPEADAKFLEFTGQGLEALERRLEEKEKQMATLGARMLMEDKRAVETEGVHLIKREGEHSVLAHIAQSVSLGMERVLQYIAQWMNVDDTDIMYQLNRDFIPTPIDPRLLVALLQSYTTGVLPLSDFVAVLQRGEVIDAEKTVEEVQEEVSGMMALRDGG